MKISTVTRSVLPFALAGLLLASGCKKQNQQANNRENPPAPPAQSAQQGAPTPAQPPATTPEQQQATAPAVTTIPAGTHIRVRLGRALGSKISQSGQTFTATVADPVSVNGTTVIRAGAPATGTVVVAKSLGRFKGKAELAIRLDSIRTDGHTYPVDSSTVERVEKGKGKRTALFAGGGAGLGAIIGGIAGGGKGALIGGLAGAGAGTAGTAFTGNKEIVIPAETVLTFRLEKSVHVR